MQEVTFKKITASILGLTLSQSKPNGLSEFKAALDAKKALDGIVYKITERGANAKGEMMIGIEPAFEGDEITVRLENASFDFVKKVFEAARDDKNSFTFAQAEIVISLDDAFRNAKKIEVPPKV